MLLVIDIENSYSNFAIFNNDKMVSKFSIKTDVEKSKDELNILLKNIFFDREIKSDDITDILISSVVPQINSVYEESMKELFDIEVKFVGMGLKSGINIKCEYPKEVGSDRISRATSAIDKYDGPIIIVNLSEITTIDVINDKKEFLGGLILPGVNIYSEGLFKSSKLPKVEMVTPEKIIGNTTVKSLQSGIYYGYINSIIGTIKDIKNSLSKEANVIVTGKYINLIKYTKKLDFYVDYDLIFNGLKKIFDLNNKD